jgi:hypothetical protein
MLFAARMIATRGSAVKEGTRRKVGRGAAGFEGHARKRHPGAEVQAELATRTKSRHFGSMSTVAEIEFAIEKLPPAEFSALLAWIKEYQAMFGASQTLFAMYDEEEAQAQS